MEPRETYQPELTAGTKHSSAASALLAGGAIALIVKVFLALNTYGTNDVLFYEGYIETAKERGAIALYQIGAELSDGTTAYHREPFWTPPFVVSYLLSIDRLASATDLSFRAWLRILSAIADSLSLFVLYRLVPIPASSAWLISLSPPAILITGFHGSTDALLVCFLLTSVLLLERHERAVWGGVFFGLSCAVKVWPIVFAPCLLLYLNGWRRRAYFMIAACTIWLASGLPHIVIDPRSILSQIVGYRGVDMVWGIRYFAKLLFPAFDSWLGAYGAVAIAIASIIAGIWLSRLRLALHARVGFLALAFLVVTPAFGYQYLLWLTPALILFFPYELAVYGVLAGCFLSVTYYSFSDINWLANTVSKSPSMVGLILEVFTWMYLARIAARLSNGLLSQSSSGEQVANS